MMGTTDKSAGMPGKPERGIWIHLYRVLNQAGEDPAALYLLVRLALTNAWQEQNVRTPEPYDYFGFDVVPVISAAGASNFAARWDPSHSGLFFERPQRQR